jgi:predicted CXXCH cytochrome family protein
MENRWKLSIALAGLAAVSACAGWLGQRPALPSIEGAEIAGTETCVACHDDIQGSFGSSAHLAMARQRTAACESCHGPGSKHVESASADDILNAATLRSYSSAQRSQMCLSCHARDVGTFWRSDHANAGVSCWSCHADALHTATDATDDENAGEREDWQRIKPVDLDHTRVTSLAEPRPGSAAAEFCYQCHSEVKGEYALQYHHPVPEGRMVCTDCHSVHGEAKDGFNDAGGERCLSCHSEIGGPWVFEHLALEDGCLPCHQPHGSTVDKLLSQYDNSMCEQCHFDSRYPLIGGVDHTSLLSGGALCIDCHFQVHGSNTDENFNPMRSRETFRGQTLR